MIRYQDSLISLLFKNSDIDTNKEVLTNIDDDKELTKNIDIDKIIFKNIDIAIDNFG